MKPWRNSSASQVGTFRRCARRWWWEKVEGLRTPTTPAMERGTMLHAQLEEYLRSGTIPDSPIARAGLEYLPDPSTVRNEDIERKLVIERQGLPVPIVGFIDLVEPAARTVTDHKTTSNFRYARTPEELRHDPQALIYCTEALTSYWPENHDVTFRHVYYRTSGRPDSRETRVVMDRMEVAAGFAGIIETVQAQAAARHQPIVEIAPTLEACGDYGGCPYQSNCNLAGGMGCAASLFANIGGNEPQKGEGKMGIFDRINERKAAQQATQATPPPATEPVVVQERGESVGYAINPPDGTPMDQRPPEPAQPELAAASEPADKPKGNSDGPYFPDGTRARGIKIDEMFVKHEEAIAALPPGAKNIWELTSALVEWHDAGRSMKRADRPLRNKLLADIALIEGLNMGAAAPAPMAEPPAEVYVGGQSDQTATVEPPAETAPESPAAPEPAPTPAPEPEPQANAYYAPPAVLYVGCVPRRADVTHLDEILRVLQEEVATAAGVAHYGLLEYGKGPRQVAALLHHRIRGGMALPGHLVADRRNPGTDAAIEVLLQYYPEVVERFG